MKIFLAIFFYLSIWIALALGHGRLTEPPSRASAWRYGFNTPKDYNDNEGFCGGFAYQWQQANGRCGICGDGWFENPRQHEAPGGRFATGTIVRSYTAGQTIKARIQITANHAGSFTFKLCNNDNPMQDPTQDCFDRNVLLQPNGDDKWTLPNRNTGFYEIDLVLPSDISCSQCILQWTYRTANSWGTDPDGTSCVGCGKQEHFRACADIAIARDGNPDPPTTLNPIPSTTKNPVATTANDPVTDAPCTNGGTRNYKRVCYFENWAWYRPGIGQMTPDDIDPTLCTHIMYGFATLDTNTLLLKAYDTWADIDNKFYEKVTSLKRYGVKVLIALGGWNDSAGNKYSRLVNDAASRQRFISNVIQFMEQHNFDGLDLDWEYPRCWQGNCNAGPASDKVNFGLWAKELSAAFKPKGLLLSAAVSAGKPTIDQAYDVRTLGQYLDFINVMSYDLHGHWDKRTGHHSALYQHSQDSSNYLNTDYSINYWISKGAPREKLIMGMPLYGQSFTLSSSNNNGLNAPSSAPGLAGPFTRQAGFLAYYEICNSINTEGWTVVGPTAKVGPYAYRNNQWVSYDDKETIRKKSEYIKAQRLGGGMVWAIGLDDFKNRCGEGRYPLLNEIKHVLSGSDECNPATTPESSIPPRTTTTNPASTPQSTDRPNPTTTPDNSGPNVCRPTEIFASQPGMSEWCITNCALGYCPSTHCICDGSPTNGPPVPSITTTTPRTTRTTTRAIQTTSKDDSGTEGCRPTPIYAAQPGMNEWCITNCAAGYCPPTHCVCGESPIQQTCKDDIPTKRCSRLKQKGRCNQRGVQRKCSKTCNVCN